MRLEDADTVAYNANELSQLLAASVEHTVVIARRPSQPPRSEPSIAAFPPVTFAVQEPRPLVKAPIYPWTITAWAMLVTMLVGIAALEGVHRHHAATKSALVEAEH